MIRRIRFSDEAVDDLEELEEFIALDKPGAAAYAIVRIRKLTSRLGSLPYLGRPSEISEVYRVSVPRLPYIIAYEVLPEEVRIIRAYHGSRDILY